MTRWAIVGATVLLLIGAGALMYRNWDRANDLQDVIDTRDRIDDADIGTGDPDDDSGWLSEWLRGQSG